jgi:hypothetical protein
MAPHAQHAGPWGTLREPDTLNTLIPQCNFQLNALALKHGCSTSCQYIGAAKLADALVYD